MSGDCHRCKLPRFWLRRFRHRPWICVCGQAWRVVWMGGGDGGIWTWEEWRGGPAEGEA